MSKRNKRFEYGYYRKPLTADELNAELRSAELEAEASQMLLDAYPEDRPFKAPKPRHRQTHPEGDKQQYPTIDDTNRAQWHAKIRQLNPWVQFLCTTNA